jgi:arabinogalactan endo-1,4-beta-galactosidase
MLGLGRLGFAVASPLREESEMLRKLLIACSSMVLLLTMGATSAAAHAVPSVVNPGFETDGAPVQSPSGWTSSGLKSADFTEAGGPTSGFELTHTASVPFMVETTQRLTHLDPGWYTLRVSVERSTGQNDAWIGLQDCGRESAQTAVPVAPWWVQVVVSTFVSDRSCTIVLHTRAAAGEWTRFDDVQFVSGAARLSILGADVSSLNKSEALGGVYRTASGRPGDALEILKDHGLNWIRLRVFVNPADGYHGTPELLKMAREAKRLGLHVLVDLHYSDFWADPGKQWTPAAWQGETFAQIKQTFTDYTRGIMLALKAQGTPPDMIQLGNEITPGMLWDYAATWTGCSTADDGTSDPPVNLTVCHTENWDQLSQLLTAGYQTVKSVSPRTKVMLQLDAGGNNGTYQWWFGNITSRNVPFDVIGASYYSYWHGTLADLQYNLNDVTARYGKDVVVVETAYPFTLANNDGTGNSIGLASQLVPGYPATPAGQAANFRDVMSIVRAVPNGKGLGVFYWDATWTAVPGNGWSPRNPASGNAWENQALFDFNNRPTPAMSDFRP